MDRETVQRVFTPAARQALTAFPIDADEPTVIAVAENVTFRVTDRSTGQPYVLRLHRPGYHTLNELISERVWIRALHGAGIAVPVPVTTTDGREYVAVSIPDTGETRQAGLTHWLEGEVLARILHGTNDIGVFEERFVQLGALMAELHNQACGWRVPPTFQRHALDADGLMGEAPFWGRFWENPVLSKAERSLLLKTRTQVSAALARYGQDPATFSLIHADLHPGNVLVDGDRVMVIDFDDAGFGWHPYDIAVALASYQSMAEFPRIEAALLRGYRTVRGLADAVQALLPMFLLIRGMAIIGWIHGRPELDRSAHLIELKDRVCTQCRGFVVPC